jgi:hypothetical protein
MNFDTPYQVYIFENKENAPNHRGAFKYQNLTNQDSV